MKDGYPTGKSDLMTAFMVRAQTLSAHRGVWAMINLPSWMSLKSFEDLRHGMLREQRIVSMVHLGRGIFGSDFGTVAFVVDNAPPGTARGVYRRLFEQHVDVRSVAAIETLFRDGTYNRYEVSQADFAAIPGSPIVYWLSEKMRAAFNIGLPMSRIGSPKAGMHGGDVNRFARRWYEVSERRSIRDAASAAEVHATDRKWVALNKGGAFRKWYGNQEYVLAFDIENYEMLKVSGNKLPSRDFYFLPSVSWSKVSSGSPAFRMYPKGFVFDVSGTPVFGSEGDLLDICSIANTEPARQLLEAMAPTLNFEIGQVASLPILSTEVLDSSHARTKSLIAESKADWDSSESSWSFKGNPLVAIVQGQ